ncbi:uncharacterized protein K452DRAFT_122362 [Aplosporella prunicola CBS 121167]|uniref:Uncharacterized protein n=1 Tax=Aplosporella prunicola CBS 121167 TaxID=1176127 RepID=A0A6A6BNC4_9PEZI|nr:uncharacterized protein K452DRAFT_122362 [Aplosporella prunicola CBS 121167]KAF2145586.1 hypothetical protein K452DRAFT_122362 [Aplosporella prunicola CBS 121167]
MHKPVFTDTTAPPWAPTIQSNPILLHSVQSNPKQFRRTSINPFKRNTKNERDRERENETRDSRQKDKQRATAPAPAQPARSEPLRSVGDSRQPKALSIQWFGRPTAGAGSSPDRAQPEFGLTGSAPGILRARRRNQRRKEEGKKKKRRKKCDSFPCTLTSAALFFFFFFSARAPERARQWHVPGRGQPANDTIWSGDLDLTNTFAFIHQSINHYATPVSPNNSFPFQKTKKKKKKKKKKTSMR